MLGRQRVIDENDAFRRWMSPVTRCTPPKKGAVILHRLETLSGNSRRGRIAFSRFS
jgi:hypothetical protein